MFNLNTKTDYQKQIQDLGSGQCRHPGSKQYHSFFQLTQAPYTAAATRGVSASCDRSDALRWRPLQRSAPEAGHAAGDLDAEHPEFGHDRVEGTRRSAAKSPDFCSCKTHVDHGSNSSKQLRVGRMCVFFFRVFVSSFRGWVFPARRCACCGHPHELASN